MSNDGTVGSGDCEFSPSLLSMKEDGDVVKAMWATAARREIEFHFPSEENDVLFKKGFSSLCVGNIRGTWLAAGILVCTSP
jgi:hypothetical protein